MDAQKRNRIIITLGTLIVAVMFVSSYASFGNNNISGSSTSTTTIRNGSTIVVYGKAAGRVVNYSDNLNMTINANKLSNASNYINTTLNGLESNNLIGSYNYLGEGRYAIILSKMSLYNFSKVISANAVYNASVYGEEYLSIPNSVALYYNTQKAQIALPNNEYGIYTSNILALNSSINVSISAVVYTNGSLYNNQLRISQG